ncbi:teneurin and n-acetylglucosamine-1-phosphodiester alpha-n-acetylglucosaminidase [Anaeramoeba flamelloides]|uniref:Teneurin and n-acetylglucosamine-1-phosphodiester alpha-n-acetylglucosaminidase n=1 Tax=Anaeramoeba flamelloides TaxID=1746091 RepID=A0ABQ8Z841_9EUKA|nr:teneurin and n-acetylglucosamine-1-phosphodiester alpha-n-acetylglucosaminidase [Anaeramoeba flamelloides]
MKKKVILGRLVTRTFCDGVDCNQEQEGGVCVMNTGECKCNSNYTGSDCKTIVCPYNKCNGHGECNTTTAKCNCEEGWTGENCTEVECPGNNCSGHGLCNLKTGDCDCEEGWSGDRCEYEKRVFSDSVELSRSTLLTLFSITIGFFILYF